MVEHEYDDNYEFNFDDFYALSYKFSNECLRDFFKKEDIYNPNHIRGNHLGYGLYNECNACEKEGSYYIKFDYQYKYDGETDTFIKCDMNDDDVIDDMMFYICEHCDYISYYIE